MFFYVDEFGGLKIVHHSFKYEMETNSVWNCLKVHLKRRQCINETVEQNILQLMLLEAW